MEDSVRTLVKGRKVEICDFYAASVATGAKLKLLGEPRCCGDYVAFPHADLLEWGGRNPVIEVIDTFRTDEAGKFS